MIRNLFINAVKVFWLLPGFLLWASFPPMGETTDCLFALAPLLWLSRNADVRTNVRRWFVNGFVFWFATLSWMPAIVKNGGPWPLVVLGWGALAAYCSLYFGAFGYLSAKYWTWANNSNTEAQRHGGYGRRLFGLIVIEPILWAGLEIVRSRFLGGFAWNQLGVAPVNCGFGAPAALGGVYLISALVILVNGTLASIAERMLAPYFANRRRKISVGGQMVSAAPTKPAFVVPNWVRSVETLLPFLVVFGIYRIAQPVVELARKDLKGDNLKVAMVQRNFPCCFQAREENPYAVYDKLLDNVAALRPDIVVLPESAMSEFGAVTRARAFEFAQWVTKKTGADSVLAGGSRYEGEKTYNSAALYDGRGVQVYDKVHLVPFGEFIPGDKWFPALQKLAPVGSCTPGELKLLSFEKGCGEGIQLGVAICFEDTDSAQMRNLAREGAQVLFFITNDSWFSHSIETVQHAWQARARAIETGLPVVRVGNSGVTGTIRPDGTASWLIGEDGKPLVDRQGTMFDRVTVAPFVTINLRTPYVLLGDAPLFGAFVLLILGMILVKCSHYAKRRALSV